MHSHQGDQHSNLGKIGGYILLISSIYLILLFLKIWIKRHPNSLIAKILNLPIEFLWGYKDFWKYVHYIGSVIACVLIWIHTIKYMGDTSIIGITGVFSSLMLAFYILTGLFLWFGLKILRKSKKMFRMFTKFHRSLVIVLILVVLHIPHIVLTD